MQVRGQFSNSRVRIFIVGDPNPIADQQVNWSNVAIAIDRSRLAAGQRLIATQEIDGERSTKANAKPIEVEEAVNGLVTFDTPLYVCGRSILLHDCSPGAILMLRQGGTILGHTTALGELAQIDFLPGKQIASGTPLRARQTICTNPTPVDTLSDIPTQPPIGPNRILPKPSIERPVKACHRLVTIRNVIPGAIVRLFRRGEMIFEQPCPSDYQQVIVDSLGEDEELAAEQAMPECEIQPSDQDRLRVGPTEPLDRPRIDGPLCAGLGQVTISRLEPGATVRIFADNEEISRWEACDRSCLFDLKTPTPAVITVQQELCGVVSAVSRGYTAASGRSGRWFVVEDADGNDLLANEFAVHAALVRTGKIVLFSGDQFDPQQSRPRADQPSIDHTEMFDCETLTVQKIGSPHFDAFCSGHALLPNGRLLVAGGTEQFVLPPDGGFHHDHFPGLRNAALFSPGAVATPWSNVGLMPGGGRWYPTLVTLASGDVLLLSGHPEVADIRHNNNTMLLFRPSAPSPWQVLGDSGQIVSTPGYLYPRLHVLPGGDVFSSTPVKSGQSALWTPGSGTTWRDVWPAPEGYAGFDFTAVLLPLLPEDQYRAQVAVFGLGEAPADPPDPPPPPRGNPQGHIIDFGAPQAPNPNPRWSNIGPRSASANKRRRLYVNTVILPTAEVFVCGGVVTRSNDATAVHDPEMLVRRSDGTWYWSQSRFAPSSVPRNYHSTALLMPDGRVWTAGSSIGGEPGGKNVRRREIEIYEPWYCCRERPVIRAWPRSVHTGARALVRVKSKRPITRLVILRAGSATHAFNPDQRYVGLRNIVHLESNLYVGEVPSPDIALPGYYLLFALTDQNVPSRGKFIKVT